MQQLSYSKLRGRIVEKYGSQERFCEAVGISSVSMSKKMTGQTGFSQQDIIKWCSLLDIELNDVGDYFFAVIV